MTVTQKVPWWHLKAARKTQVTGFIGTPKDFSIPGGQSTDPNPALRWGWVPLAPKCRPKGQSRDSAKRPKHREGKKKREKYLSNQLSTTTKILSPPVRKTEALLQNRFKLPNPLLSQPPNQEPALSTSKVGGKEILARFKTHLGKHG